MADSTISPKDRNTYDKLMFQPFSSILDPGFWQQLTRVKLNDLKLSHGPASICGTYANNLADFLPPLASFDHTSFDKDVTISNKSSCPMHGQFLCFNRTEEFLKLDKKRYLEDLSDSIWQAIIDGRALSDPELYLTRFGLIVYADLKKYKFSYWFAFPALHYPLSIRQVSSYSLRQILKSESIQSIQKDFDSNTALRSFSIIRICKLDDEEKVSVHHLKLYHDLVVESAEKQHKLFFAFHDPSSDPKYPGWPLRNLLCLIGLRFALKQVSVICLRRNNTSIDDSLVLDLELEINKNYNISEKYFLPIGVQSSGWEKGDSQQPAPKRVDLSSFLDPKRLAEDAVNLNLKLMKWRLAPELDLELISNAKCLILGCGTLGCHIARGLLAWGVKNLTLVDNSKVSYSNPVRQSLYTFSDCSAGVFKAEAAAASIKQIHPIATVNPIVMSIPMPGHRITSRELDQVRKDVQKLEELIEGHDVIFLLMDTRESRWLPSVIALAKQKLVINAAIGYDTFLLQRYGIRDYAIAASSDTQCIDEKAFVAVGKLGCYFCNDVVAPGDSTLDRTLDQQCTVSRPGVAMMVSAMAVELLASVLSSPLGQLTPAPLDISREVEEEGAYSSELGIVPHTIRGNIAMYHIYKPTSMAFNKCSTCSHPVVETYLRDGFEFVKRVCEDPNYLEEVAGLTSLQNISDDVLELESEED